MNEDALRELLAAFRQGDVAEDDVVDAFRALPFSDLGFAHYDHHRALRRGFPEVIFGLGKTRDHLIRLLDHACERHTTLLATRVEPEDAEAALAALPDHGLRYAPLARCLYRGRDAITPKGRGTILVVCAGTSDLPVASEAALTAELMGHTVERVNDVGVAGLHRILAQQEALISASVIIVCAGMEGALASVVAGLVPRPVIAVPTSVGYGAHLSGLTPLLGMLTSCAPGVTVVNIDNGFGAAYAACLMNQDP